jgi:hypothetical protein
MVSPEPATEPDPDTLAELLADTTGPDWTGILAAAAEADAAVIADVLGDSEGRGR